MSEELKDEVEAINSIYGDGSLEQAGAEHVYVLTPPGRSSSLRIEFPDGYPEEPPAVIGTNSTGEHGKKGDAARELSLFRRAVGAVYQPGAVCLFDAIEELGRLLEEEEEQQRLREEAQAQTAREEGGHTDDTPDGQGSQEEAAMTLSEPPPWILSDLFIENKSTFVARCAVVSSTAQAEAFVQHLLDSDKKVRAATHNITAWRIKGPGNATFQDCDDDGETAAGGRLLHLMQLMDLWNVMVVVTRWYGGVKLGPRRFALINQTARDAFIQGGFIPDPASSSGGTKKKGPGKN